MKNEFKDESALSGTFRIAAVSVTDAGDYECIADNGIIPSISSNFTITINGMHILLRKFSLTYVLFLLNVAVICM